MLHVIPSYACLHLVADIFVKVLLKFPLQLLSITPQFILKELST